MKKIIALSILAAAAAAPAFAQSNITVYGRLNLSIERQKDGDVSNTVVQDNSSRIGFKGTEDLGGGLKANVVLEHGFNAGTGTAASTFWGREATVGLSGSFGSVRLGRMAATDAYFATADYISMHNHDTGTSSDAFYAGPALIAGLSNTITYTTPTIAGFSASAQYGAALTSSHPYYGLVGAVHPQVLAGNYDAGPVHLGFGYEKVGDYKTTIVRGLYEMGAYTFGAYVGQDSGTIERTYFRLSGMYAMGNSEFHVNVGQSGEISGLPDSDATQWTLGYNYNLSKRTKVYAFYTRQNFSGPSTNFSSLALGLRHNF